MANLSVSHLLGIKNLKLDDIELIFKTADHFKEVINRPIKKAVDPFRKKCGRFEKLSTLQKMSTHQRNVDTSRNIDSSKQLSTAQKSCRHLTYPPPCLG